MIHWLRGGNAVENQAEFDNMTTVEQDDEETDEQDDTEVLVNEDAEIDQDELDEAQKVKVEGDFDMDDVVENQEDFDMPEEEFEEEE